MSNTSSYVFEFLAEHDDDGSTIHEFRGNLKKEQCGSFNKKGVRCGRPTVIGLGVCWQHMEKILHLRIKEEQHGKGLYAQDRSLGKNNRDILFHDGDTIAMYNGELLSKRAMDARYDAFTAPYGNTAGGRVYNQRTRRYSQMPYRREDGALNRGIGTMANHRPSNEANARFQFVKDDSNRDVIGLVATKNIRNYEPVHVNYGAGYNISGKYKGVKYKGRKYKGGISTSHSTTSKPKNYLTRFM